MTHPTQAVTVALLVLTQGGPASSPGAACGAPPASLVRAQQPVSEVETRPVQATTRPAEPQALRTRLESLKARIWPKADTSQQIHSPAGGVIATGRGFHGWLWDAESGELLFRLPASREEPGSGFQELTFDRTGRYVKGREHDGALSVWETQTGAFLGSPDQVLDAARQVIEWNAESKPEPWVMLDGRDASRERLRSPSPLEPRQIATACAASAYAILLSDERLLVVDPDTERATQVRRFEPGSGVRLVGCVSNAPDHTLVFVCERYGRRLGVVDLQPEQPQLCWLAEPTARDGWTDLVQVACGRGGLHWLLLEGGAVLRWEGGSSAVLEDIAVGIRAIAAPAQGDALYCLTAQGAVLRCSDTGSSPQQILARDPERTALAVSPDGRSLACGRLGGRVELWDLVSGKLQANLAPAPGDAGFEDLLPGSRVEWLTFSASGERLAIACEPLGLRLVWDPRRGRELWSDLQSYGVYFSTCFSCSEEQLLAGASDSGSLVLDAQTGEVLLSAGHYPMLPLARGRALVQDWYGVLLLDELRTPRSVDFRLRMDWPADRRLTLDGEGRLEIDRSLCESVQVTLGRESYPLACFLPARDTSGTGASSQRVEFDLDELVPPPVSIVAIEPFASELECAGKCLDVTVDTSGAAPPERFVAVYESGLRRTAALLDCTPTPNGGLRSRVRIERPTPAGGRSIKLIALAADGRPSRPARLCVRFR